MWARFVNTIPRGLSSGLQFRADNPPQTGAFALPPFTNFPALTDIPEPAEEIKQPEGVQPVLGTIEDEDLPSEADAMTGSKRAEEVASEIPQGTVARMKQQLTEREEARAAASSSENKWDSPNDRGSCKAAKNDSGARWFVTNEEMEILLIQKQHQNSVI